MADKRSIAIRREAALAVIVAGLGISTEPEARDPDLADVILLEAIAGGLREINASIARLIELAESPNLYAAICAADDADLAGLGLTAAQIAKVRAAVTPEEA